MHTRWLIPALLAPVLAAPGRADEPKGVDPLESIRAEDFLTHVRWLADDAREGRLTGSPGERAATQYVSERFAEWGLEPGGDDGGWFQPFPIASRPFPGDGCACTLRDADPTRSWAKALACGDDFRPLGASADGEAEGRVVFAGWGETQGTWDDWAGIDAQGAIVVLLRLEAEAKPAYLKLSGGGMFMRARFEQRQIKAAAAKGAAAVIFVPAPGRPDVIGRVERAQKREAIPVLFAKRAVLGPLLQSHGCDLDAWVASAAAKAATPPPAAVGLVARVSARIRIDKMTGRNVIGVLRGADPERRREVVVIGAHADHVGWNEEANGTDQSLDIHNGADDNASGTAGLLEVAQAFATSPHRPGRTVVFASFTGEELGLLGSQHYVKHPAFPLADTVAMINLDMIGRASDGKCNVEACDSSPAFREIVEKYNPLVGLTLKYAKGVRPDSDHYPFISRGVPALFFFTGMHPDYHKFTDDADKINGADAAKTARLAFLVAADLAAREGRPAFVAPKAPAMPGRPRGAGPRLGVMPDYDAEVEGLRMGDVVPDGPGGRAGMLAGDVVRRIGERKVTDIQTFMEALAAQKHGTTVEVEVLRGKETVVLKVAFDPGPAAAPAPAPAPADAEQPRPRLGIYPTGDGEGVIVGDCVPDGPGAKAGLLADDVIVRIGKTPVLTLAELQEALGALKLGDTAEVEVKRGTERKVLKVTFPKE